MVKLISQLIGAKIILFQERARIGEVIDLLIDPKDGAFVGLEIIEERENKYKYIPPSEIKGLGQGFVMVKDLNSLSEEEDVIKIKEVLSCRPEIIKSKVYSEDGEFIGRVVDATINFKLSALEKIYVTPKMSIKFFSENLVISAKQIVEIKKREIIVKNGKRKVKESKFAPVVTPISE